VSNDVRNTRVVVALILAMTVGARALLWLEPTAPASAVSMPLMAAGGTPVENVTIEYSRAGETPAAGWDCLIMPDGTCHWRAAGPQVRLVVKGSETDELPYEQKEALLATLGSVTLGRGGQLVDVRLSPPGDGELDGEAPSPTKALRALLVAKRLVD